MNVPTEPDYRIGCDDCLHTQHWRECQVDVVGLLDTTYKCPCRRRGPSGTGWLTLDGKRVLAGAHPGYARGTYCLTAHFWTGTEWDCGCIDPICEHDGPEDAATCPWADWQGGWS